MAGLIEPRPHDLLRLADPVYVVPWDAPPWVTTALCESPWVVVRRGMAAEGWVAVGVRGKARAHRFAMDVPDTMVTEVLAPEDLSMRIEALEPTLPAGRALRAASALLDRTAVPWGPTGSVGFELASNVRTVTAGSDLDLLLRPGRLPTRAWLKHLHVALRRLPARVDCQIETADGAVALGEVISAAREVLVRTPTGPRLIPAPWPAAA